MPNDTQSKRTNKILRAAEQVLRGAGRVGLPLYSSVRSKHSFTQHQLLVLLVLREMLSKSFRDFVDWLALMTALLRRLRLRAVPYFTTLQKFSLRLDLEAVEHTLAALAATAAGGAVVAIDSTGLRESAASYYFMRTMALRRDAGGTEERAVRRHLKHTIVVDTATLMIWASSSAPGPGADVDKLVPTLSKLAGQDIVAVVGDKGYDSEANRRFVRQLGSEAHIPLRKVKKLAAQHHGRLRRRQLATFDEAVYARRPLVETTHAAEKRTMDDLVRARLPTGKRNEVALGDLAYNARRAAALEEG